MDLQLIRAVFQLVGHALSSIGKLALFANRNKPGTQLIGDGRSKDESPGLNTNNILNVLFLEFLGQKIDCLLEGILILKKGRYILENNALLGKIGNIADVLLEITFSDLEVHRLLFE